MKRSASALCILMLASTSLFALDFDVVPNDNGTFDINLAHSWEWADGWFSGFDLAYLNPLSIVSDDTYYVATSGTSLEASADLLGIRGTGPVSFSLAANILYSPSTINEVGYVDADDGRYFLVNDRHIELLLPRIKAGVSGYSGVFSGSFSAEFAPWFPVSLSQTLSVGTGGPRDEMTHISNGYGMGAWSATASAAMRTTLVSPSFEALVDWVPVAYSYLDYALQEQSLNSIIMNVSVFGGVTINALKLGGSSPRIMIGYEWNKVRDTVAGTLIVDDPGSLRFKVGLGL